MHDIIAVLGSIILILVLLIILFVVVMGIIIFFRDLKDEVKRQLKEQDEQGGKDELHR